MSEAAAPEKKDLYARLRGDAEPSEGNGRGFWLNSLIVGAAILVWLYILGSIIVGVALAAA